MQLASHGTSDYTRFGKDENEDLMAQETSI